MQVIEEREPAVEVIGATREVSFLAWLLLPPLIVYLGGFLLPCMPGYERWSGSKWAPTLEYAFQTADQNADIVVYGDSTALYGVDPLQMEKDLGLKVVNLPNTMGSLPVVDDLSLHLYLAHNRAPKLIVLYLSSWNLNYMHPWGPRLFEGEEMLLRHGSWSQIFHFAAHHLEETLNFPFRVYSGLGPHVIVDVLHGSHAVPEIVASRGHEVNDLPVGPLASDCTLPDTLLEEHRTDSVQALINRYSTPQTKTMLYLSPVPGCQNADALLSAIRAKNNLPAALPAVLAASDFSSDNMFAHVRPDAVSTSTDLLTQAIRGPQPHLRIQP
jgi:hypothetical protein